jgi:hypothetical protein
MSTLSFTQLVTPDTCIGDSLATFNSNFSALDDALYKQPAIVPGRGTTTSQHITEQNAYLTQVNTNNSFIYDTRFDSTAYGAVRNSSFIYGDWDINGVTFPYVNPSTGLQNPAL